MKSVMRNEEGKERKNMSKVILFGIGHIAEVVHFYLTNDSEHEVAAFTVDREYLQENTFKGLPVIPFEEIEKIYSPSEYKMSIPISYKNMNKIRAKKYYAAKKKGYSFISYISTNATYYGTPIGENSFVFENSIVQPFTKIGDDVIVWSGCQIAHHAKIEDHCFIASQAVISGSAIIGEYSFLGANSTIRDSVVVAKENLIGAGTVILKNTKEKEVFKQNGTLRLNKLSDQMIRI